MHTENGPGKRIRFFLSVLKRLSLFRMICITGASAMRGYKNTDDVDLCMVTASGCLWFGRFLAVVLAKMMGIHAGTGVCLNLFFDEKDLAMPERKKNSYIAHEILQMKTVFDKDGVGGRFLDQNRWILSYFPNAPVKRIRQPIGNGTVPFLDLLDPFFRRLQLPRIKRYKAAFHITRTQLWLFKNDFEKKLKRKGLVL